MRIREYVRYRNREDYPMESYPAISDFFYTLSMRVGEVAPSRRVLGIVGLYPFRRSARPIDTISFVTFSTTRTTYAALKDVEDIFADFYLQSGILPYINPLPQVYFKEPELLPGKVKSILHKQGAYIYGVEE